MTSPLAYPFRLTLLLILLMVSSIASSQSILSITGVIDSLEKIMKKERIPGMMLSVVKNDSLLFSGGLGMADVKAKVKVSGQHHFRMGSVTKSFTALAIKVLEKQGKINPQATVKSIAPELLIDNPWEADAPVRVIHLLEHTAGFDDMHFSVIYRRAEDGLSHLEQVNRHEKSMRCRWKPGSYYSYSNPGYAVLGYLIEKVSGKKYEDFVKEQVLVPIGMTNSFFIGFEPKAGFKRVTGYALRPKNEVKVAESFAIYGNGAGGLISTADDFSKWLLFLNLPQRAVQPLSITLEDLSQMRKASASYAAKQGVNDVYAWGISPGFYDKPQAVFGHDGGIDGFVSYYGYVPETRSGFALSINCMESAGKLSNLLSSFITQEISRKEVVTQKLPTELKKVLEKVNGSYRLINPRNQLFYASELMFSSMRFKYSSDTLYASQLFNDPVPFVYTGGQSFTRVGNCCPSLHLVQNEEQEWIFLLDDYFAKESFPWGLFWRIVFFSGFLLGMVLAVFGLIWCIMLIMKGINLHEFRERMIPVLALASFMGLLFGISMAFGNLIEAASVNPLTLSIFICSLAFPAFSFLGTFIWGKRLIKKEFSFNSIFLFISSLIMALFSSLLIGTGIFGLMIWNG